MAVDLKNHPGLNPAYFRQMEARQAAMAHNKAMKRRALALGLNPDRARIAPVPKQPNKYVPHIGAKQRAKASV